MRRRAGAALLLALAATGATRDPLEGRTPGPAKRCLPISQNQSLTIAADRVILYRESSRRIWRTEPIGVCARMRSTDTLVIDVFGGSICRGDRFRVVSPGLSIPSAPCRFGDFVPYDRDKVSGATK